MSESPEEMRDGIVGGLENWCIVFNRYSEVLFMYLKYIFVFMLIMVGILTMKKFRGYWQKVRKEEFKLKEKKTLKEKLKEPYVKIGIMYIMIAFGILLTYLTRFLMLILDPLPDGFIFDFLINNIKDLMAWIL